MRPCSSRNDTRSSPTLAVSAVPLLTQARKPCRRRACVPLLSEPSRERLDGLPWNPREPEATVGAAFPDAVTEPGKPPCPTTAASIRCAWRAASNASRRHLFHSGPAPVFARFRGARPPRRILLGGVRSAHRPLNDWLVSACKAATGRDSWSPGTARHCPVRRGICFRSRGAGAHRRRSGHRSRAPATMPRASPRCWSPPAFPAPLRAARSRRPC